MEQITNLGNSSTHILEENWTFFYNSPTSVKFSILSITNDGSIQLNPFKSSMDDH